jgi:uncharacterized protein (TIGR02246 family)
MANTQRRIEIARRAAAVLMLALLALGCAQKAKGQAKTLSAKDTAAIKATIEKYRTSWLAGDSEGVLSTFTDDGVLLPASAGAPVIGREAMRNYWWPAGGPPIKITKFEVTCEQVGGDGQIAYVFGRDELSWTMEENGAEKNHSNFSTYLNVMKKLPDGSWRISHHMWDDDPAKRK